MQSFFSHTKSLDDNAAASLGPVQSPISSSSPPLSVKSEQATDLLKTRVTRQFALPMPSSEMALCHGGEQDNSWNLQAVKYSSLSDTVVSDLQLEDAVYPVLFQHPSLPPGHDSGESGNATESADLWLVPQWRKHLVHDPAFLLSQQSFVQSLAAETPSSSSSLDPTLPLPVQVSRMEPIWQRLYGMDTEGQFRDMYSYLDFPWLEELNRSSSFLNYWSMINFLSPALAIFLPLFFLIAPFFLLKLQGVAISFATYVSVLKGLAKNHTLGKILSWEKFDLHGLLYFVFTLVMYAFQFYNNVRSCIRFYNNLYSINADILYLRQRVAESLQGWQRTLVPLVQRSYETTSPHFVQQLLKTQAQLQSIHDMIGDLPTFTFSLQNVMQVGHMLRCYYELHTNIEYRYALEHMVFVNLWWRNMTSVAAHLAHQTFSLAQFVTTPPTPTDSNMSDKEEDKDEESEEENDETNEEKDAENEEENDKTNHDEERDEDEKEEEKEEKDGGGWWDIRGQFYAPLLGASALYKGRRSSIVINDCALDKNYLITGPNASGKTTFIKTTAINIVLTQQFGGGFYRSDTKVPLDRLYTKIHSYLNIPDTSNRDSLFQAEARRCKEILDEVMATLPSASSSSGMRSERHFCIFDELFSGTNAEEANEISYAYLLYLQAFPHVDFMLTTHFTELCRRMEDLAEEDVRVQNWKMDAVVQDETMKLHYTISRGINNIKGAYFALRDLHFPHDMWYHASTPFTPTTPQT